MGGKELSFGDKFRFRRLASLSENRSIAVPFRDELGLWACRSSAFPKYARRFTEPAPERAVKARRVDISESLSNHLDAKMSFEQVPLRFFLLSVVKKLLIGGTLLFELAQHDRGDM